MVSNFQQNGDPPIDLRGLQMPAQTGSFIKWGAVILGLVLLFVLVNFLRGVYTDWLWYDSLGFRSVFVKILWTRIVLFLIGSLAFGALLGASFYVAHRLASGPVDLPTPPEMVDMLRKILLWGSVIAAVVISVIFGVIFASKWEIFLRFASSVSFEQEDPVFGKDLSFYVFTLPVYSFIQTWLLGAAIVTLLATAGIYFAHFTIRGVKLDLTSGLKIHLSVIAALLMFVLAWGHWLDRWDLLLSGRGAVFGAAYADIHARKPALLILTIIASASGILMLVNAYLRGLRLLAGAAVLWIVMVVVLSAAWPSVMQQFTVNPNEFAKEQPYIARNMELTRMGYGMGEVESVFYQAESAVTAELIRDNPQTINNIRLWDYRPLSDVYKQIQLIRPYYDFKDADVDRYTLGGEYRQVLLSAREVAPEKLESESRTWVNEKLIYTHGIGLAMSPATEFTSEGRPEFFARDIPADGVIPISTGAVDADPDIVITNPRIYYGENTLDYVIVNTNTDELDYQTEAGELFRTNYFGSGGVRLNSFIRKLAYAWEFGDVNVLISGEITSDSLLQYRRDIQTRISTVAPFLRLDSDPYMVAADDQLFWIQDAYTVTDHYPYSDPIDDDVIGSFNYIRNSVKITVDAFNGTLRFYVWDTSDPIVMTYKKIFPKLFVAKEEMSQALQEHVRYPQGLFAIQTEKYIRYHMNEPQDFYNNEDLWAFPNEKIGQSETLQRVEPYYVIMKLPGEEREEFVQLLPFTPNQRQNLVGWLAARSDGENYGKLIAFNFPKDRQVDGPQQVEARIDNDQEISAWFTLRCSQGSSCIRGNLLVIPVGESILYAEPVYIQADVQQAIPVVPPGGTAGTAPEPTGDVRFPELKRVILATGDRVVMEDTLVEALVALTDDASLSTPSGPAEPVVSPAGETVVPSEFVPQVEALADSVAEIKSNIEALEEVLERLLQLTGGE